MRLRVRLAHILTIPLLATTGATTTLPTASATVAAPGSGDRMSAAAPVARSRVTGLPPRGFVPAPVRLASMAISPASLLSSHASMHNRLAGGLRKGSRIRPATPQPPPLVSMGTVQGRFFANSGYSNGTFDIASTATPLFTQQFTDIDFNPPSSAQVSCTNSTGVNENTGPMVDVLPQPDGSCATQTGAYITSVADGSGRTVQYAYTGGDLTASTDVLNRTTSYAYTNHLLTGITNPLGQTVMSTSYDAYTAAGRVISQTVQDGSQILVNYTADTTTITTTGTDGTSQVEQILYDPLRNVATGDIALTGSGSGIVREQEQPDQNFAPGTSTDGDNNTTASTFNTMGLPLTVTDPTGATTSFQYDAHNNPITVTDTMGRQSVYDAYNDLVRQTTGITTGSICVTTVYTYRCF